ncbi:hypothetical protein RND81_02G197800 [Saponaria officinalis]|uniref:Aminotransferase-like plant mobile domain-containing protein n=1 Tax=Saponaria officinalis TaxID=3572 RepID=A0AAW1MSC1_SAPOF
MASLMADGRTINLATLVLAGIYNGIHDLVTHPNPAFSSSTFPAHYLYGWIAHYFGTHHDVKPPPQGPAMVVHSGTRGAKAFNEGTARDLIHGGKDVSANCFILNKNKAELLIDDGQLEASMFDYLISLRSSYLPLRLGNCFYVEPYNPHRFSRQFGFCQDICGLLPRELGNNTISRHEALRFLRVSLFASSQSQVFLPSLSIKWHENVTTDFSSWWRRVGINDFKTNIQTLVHGVDNDRLKSGRDHPDDGERRVSKVVPETASSRKRGFDGNHNDVESDVDPKHERRGKIRTPPLDTDFFYLSEGIFEGVPSCSHLPLQLLVILFFLHFFSFLRFYIFMQEADLNLELAAALQTDGDVASANILAPERPLKVLTGKGKEIAMIDKAMPLREGSKSLSQNSVVGSSFSNVDDNSVDSPVVPHIVGHQRTFGTVTTLANFSSAPVGSLISIRPPLPFIGVFDRALPQIQSLFLTELKNACFSDVGKVAAKANESYRTIRHLKGDPTPLREQVDSYVGAVNAYLILEKLAAEHRRSEDAEQGIVLQHQKLDDAKRFLTEADEERLAIAAEHSAVTSKIADLEAELTKACEMAVQLNSRLETKDKSLMDLRNQVEVANRSLAELEAQPVMSADEEASLQEQKASLEEMRASLSLGP